MAFRPIRNSYSYSADQIDALLEKVPTELDFKELSGKIDKKVTDKISGFEQFDKAISSEVSTFITNYERFIEGLGWGEDTQLSTLINDRINDKLATVIQVKGVWDPTVSGALPSTATMAATTYTPSKRRHVAY